MFGSLLETQSDSDHDALSGVRGTDLPADSRKTAVTVTNVCAQFVSVTG